MGKEFTEEEFQIMVKQLLDKKSVSFDMLSTIAEKALHSAVMYWCSCDSLLNNPKDKEDLMQDIHLKLIKTCKTSFLLRDGTVNNDSDGFNSWMYTVACNTKRDYLRKLRRRTATVQNFTDGEEENIPDKQSTFDTLSNANTDAVKEAFSIVLNSKNRIYKVLTWVAQCIFILEFDITKIKSNGLIVKTFEEKTLGEMYAMLKNETKNISWLCISDTQNEFICKKLNKKWDATRKYRDVPYKEFFMKKGGKKTVSDWINRMNNMIKQVMKK